MPSPTRAHPRGSTLARARVATSRAALPLVVGLGACASFVGPAAFAPEVPDVVAANRAAGDPYDGRFPYDLATQGLPAGRPVLELLADGATLRCQLEPEHAPIAVAHVVGLARGLRPVRGADGAWRTLAYYDGARVHRVEPGQFVQFGERVDLPDPGVRVQDEVSPGDLLDRAGVLALANKGTPHTGGAQLFVTLGPTPHLAGQHTLLGTCEPEHVARGWALKVERGLPLAIDRATVTVP